MLFENNDDSMKPLLVDDAESSSEKYKRIQEISDKFDMCFIFPANDDPNSANHFEKKGEEIVRILILALGDDNIIMYRSASRITHSNDDEEKKDKKKKKKKPSDHLPEQRKIIVLVRFSIERTKYFSDMKNCDYLADEVELEKRARAGWEEDEEKGQAKIHPLTIDMYKRKDISQYGPFEYIYLKYKLDERCQTLYKVSKTSFTKVERLKLLVDLLNDDYDGVDDGVNIPLDKVQQVQPGDTGPVVLSLFPLHDEKQLNELKKMLFSKDHWFPWKLDYDMMNAYFGEKIALYFKFTGHFSRWLALPAFVGLAFEIYIEYTAESSQVGNPLVPVYSVFIVIWGVFMLEYWKQEEAHTAMKWGTLDFIEEESVRSEFKDFEKVQVTGKQTLYFDRVKKRWLLLRSFCLILGFCGIVIATVAGIYILRVDLSKRSKSGYDSAAFVSSFMNAAQVQFFGYLFALVSEDLTDSENHRTDTEYEDSMIAKTFVFSFINSYASFFFVAYFAAIVPKPTYPGQPPDDNIGMCGYPDCMQALAVDLGIVLASNIGTNMVFLIMDYVSYKQREKEQTEDVAYLTPAEKQSVLDKRSFKDLIRDYMQIAILFGYMNLFVAALPGIAFIAFLSLWIEIKADAWRLLTLTQRGWPALAENIGTFQIVFDLMNSAAVITNGSLIAFTMPILQGFSQTFRFWAFLLFVWVISASQYIIRQAVPEIPLDVQIQKERTKYYERKLIKRLADDRTQRLPKEDRTVTKEWLKEICRQKCSLSDTMSLEQSIAVSGSHRGIQHRHMEVHNNNRQIFSHSRLLNADDSTSGTKSIARSR